MSYQSAIAGPLRAAFAPSTSPITFRGVGGDYPVNAFMRGIRDEDLFVEAKQQDMFAQVDAVLFIAATGQPTPRAFDRIVCPLGAFNVETWRQAPMSGPPVFFKMLLRGGQQ